MKNFLQTHLFVILGWLFVVLGGIGVILPILPTTPFLIVALACFSKSSPRFHQMLLNNARFGPILREWEENRTVSRQTKYKVYVLVIIAFSISIAIFNDRTYLQLSLAGLALILLFFIWRLKE